jgi:hypothetical protein
MLEKLGTIKVAFAVSVGIGNPVTEALMPYAKGLFAEA